MFRYFTNGEYEKAKDSLKNKKEYKIHLVTGIGGDCIEHYKIPASVFIDKAKPEVSWYLPIRKEIEGFKVKEE